MVSHGRSTLLKMPQSQVSNVIVAKHRGLPWPWLSETPRMWQATLPELLEEPKNGAIVNCRQLSTRKNYFENYFSTLILSE